MAALQHSGSKRLGEGGGVRLEVEHRLVAAGEGLQLAVHDALEAVTEADVDAVTEKSDEAAGIRVDDLDADGEIAFLLQLADAIGVENGLQTGRELGRRDR